MASFCTKGIMEFWMFPIYFYLAKPSNHFAHLIFRLTELAQIGMTLFGCIFVTNVLMNCAARKCQLIVQNLQPIYAQIPTTIPCWPLSPQFWPFARFVIYLPVPMPWMRCWLIIKFLDSAHQIRCWPVVRGNPWPLAEWTEPIGQWPHFRRRICAPKHRSSTDWLISC